MPMLSRMTNLFRNILTREHRNRDFDEEVRSYDPMEDLRDG